MTDFKICSERSTRQLEHAIKGTIFEAERSGEVFRDIRFSTAIHDNRQCVFSALLIFERCPVDGRAKS